MNENQNNEQKIATSMQQWKENAGLPVFVHMVAGYQAKNDQRQEKKRSFPMPPSDQRPIPIYFHHDQAKQHTQKPDKQDYSSQTNMTLPVKTNFMP